MQDEEATVERDLLVYPDQGIVTPEEHRRVVDRSTGVIGVDEIAQDESSVLGNEWDRNTSPSPADYTTRPPWRKRRHVLLIKRIMGWRPLDKG
jgi:hypothetical protein